MSIPPRTLGSLNLAYPVGGAAITSFVEAFVISRLDYAIALLSDARYEQQRIFEFWFEPHIQDRS